MPPYVRATSATAVCCTRKTSSRSPSHRQSNTPGPAPGKNNRQMNQPGTPPYVHAFIRQPVILLLLYYTTVTFCSADTDIATSPANPMSQTNEKASTGYQPRAPHGSAAALGSTNTPRRPCETASPMPESSGCAARNVLSPPSSSCPPR